MFFEFRETSSVKHRRLDHFSAVLPAHADAGFAGAALRQPLHPRAPCRPDGKKLIVVAIDHSFSMRDGDRLARAKEQAQQVIANLKPGDQAQVIALAGQVQSLTQVVNDPGALRAAVAASSPAIAARPLVSSRASRTLSEVQKMPLEVHLVSDLQKSAMPPGFTDLRLVPAPRYLASSRWPENELDCRKRSRPAPRLRSQAREDQATIAGFGTPAAKRNVSLFLNGSVLQSKTVDVPAERPRASRISGTRSPLRIQQGEVRIDAADSLPGDDQFLFLGRAHRSAQSPVHRRRPPSARRILLPHRARFLRRWRHSKWMRSVPSAAASTASPATRSSC